MLYPYIFKHLLPLHEIHLKVPVTLSTEDGKELARKAVQATVKAMFIVEKEG